MQPTDFYREAIETIGAKKVAAALGLSVPHVYRLKLPEEEGGSRTDLDRFVMLIDVMGSHPAARPLLKQMRLFIESQFARVLDGEDGSAMTGASLARDGATVLREVAEFVAALDEPDQMDMRKALREGAEALHVVEQMLRRLMAMSASRDALRAVS